MLSCVLSALSAALMLVPFLSVYRILGELLARGAGPENAAFFGRQALIAFGAMVLGFISSTALRCFFEAKATISRSEKGVALRLTREP